MPVTDKCIDDMPHNFIFREKTSREVSWHNFKYFDLYYCTKCLKYHEVEIEQPRRW